MSASEGWDKAEVLVHRTVDGRLETDQSTLKRLSSIKSPVHVVAVVGPYRTGKSYLLNIIIEELFGKTDVFPVGSTVQAQTKGIRIWCGPHPSVKDHWIVFLDTEGLNDVEQGDRDRDILIFVLTVLLSSTLVYNSSGVIDFRALETIHHVSVLAEKIRLMPDLSDDLEDIGFDLAFPELLWVVRDFQLNLEMSGKRITDDEYLENALSTSNMVLGPKKSVVISVKRCIKEYFAKRKCFLLPNLIRSKDASANGILYQREPTADLINRITVAECKMHQGSEVTGLVLGKLADILVEECQRFDSQKPVNIPEIMDRIAEKENKAAVDKSLELYRTEMGERTTEAVEEVSLHQIHLNCSERAMTNFMHSAVYPVDGGFITLMNAIRLEFDRISENNAAKINQLCNQTFSALRKEIIGDSNIRYLCPGGFQKYQKDMTELRTRWEKNPVLQGVAGRSFFNNMVCKLKESEAKLILDADKSMTDLKRIEAVERQKRRHLEELKKQNDEMSALDRDRTAFEDRVTRQVKGAILRPQEAEISSLNCRISVLDRELSDLRTRHAEEEAETCEQRLQTYERMLSEKRNEPSKWKKVSLSIQLFARGTLDSIRKLFRLSSVDDVPFIADTVPATVPVTVPATVPATVPTPYAASPAVLADSPIASRASSCGHSSTSPVAYKAAKPGSCSASVRSAAAASSGSSSSSSSPTAASTAISTGSSSSLPVSSTAAASGTSSSSLLASSAAACAFASSATELRN